MAAIVVEAAHSDGPHLMSITGAAVPWSSNPTHGLALNSPTSVVASTRISDGRVLSPRLIEQASHLWNHHGQRCGLWRGGGGRGASLFLDAALMAQCPKVDRHMPRHARPRAYRSTR